MSEQPTTTIATYGIIGEVTIRGVPTVRNGQVIIRHGKRVVACFDARDVKYYRYRGGLHMPTGR